MRRLAGLAGVVALVGALFVVAPVAVPAGGQEQTRPASTPQLIAQAAASGAISSADRLRFLAFALFHPDRLPAEYHGSRPWDGTGPLLELQEGVAGLPDGPLRDELRALMTPDRPPAAEPGTTVYAATPGDGATVNAETPPDGASRACGEFNSATPNIYTSTHFYIEYRASDLVGTGLTAADYATSLETSWTTETQTFGWAIPPVKTSDPAPGNRIHVRLEPLGLQDLGFTTTDGKHAGLVGDNPSTPWAEIDAYATCMVLNSNFAGPAGPSHTAQQVLDATSAHEFNHTIQAGLGALTGTNRPDLNWIEGITVYMEDEVYDGANLGDEFLYPVFSDSLGDYNAGDPYPFWFVFRGLFERFGTGNAGGGENVAQEFWERLSQYNVNDNGALMQDALSLALSTRGVSLADAFHAYAIAAKFMKTCGGDYGYPYCFEEAAGYTAAAGVPAVHRTISTVGQSATASVEDNYAINWVRLPTSGGPYRVTLTNSAPSGAGQLRATVVCDTGSALRLAALPSVVTGGGSTGLASFDPAGCSSVVAVLTNQSQTAPNPSTSVQRAYTLSTGPVAVLPSWRGGVVRGNRWFLRDAPETLPAGVANVSFVFGDAGDVPLMCDWDGDGLRTAGVRRGISFFLRDENSSGPASRPELPYGNPGDRAVCGDWDGDGDETVGLVRGNEWFLKGNNDVGGGGDQHFFYGDPGDVPVVGDWDGDGDTDIGVRRGIVFYLRTGGGGVADIAPFAYGDPGDIPFSSDPDRDGRASVGVHRRGQWFLISPAASSFYGDTNDRPLIWFVPGG